MHLDPSLVRWARAHHQLVTRDRWVGSGRTSRSFDRAVDAGVLHHMGPNVALLVGGNAALPETRIAAVVLSTDRPLRASHTSGGYLWGGPIVGVDPIEVTALDRATGLRRPGVIVHRPTDDEPERSIMRAGIPTTNPFRTLVDLGATDPSAVPVLLESLLIDNTITVRGAAAGLERYRRRGRPGVSALVDALDHLALGSEPPDSVLETAMARLFADHGIDGWVFHHRACGFELDFAFPDVMVDIEVDGWDPHGWPVKFDSDRERDSVLTAAGWSVMRITWVRVTNRPAGVAAQVRAAVDGRRRR